MLAIECSVFGGILVTTTVHEIQVLRQLVGLALAEAQGGFGWTMYGVQGLSLHFQTAWPLPVE